MLDWHQNQANRDKITLETGGARWAQLAQEFGLNPLTLRADERRILELCAARIGGYEAVIAQLTARNVELTHRVEPLTGGKAYEIGSGEERT